MRAAPYTRKEIQTLVNSETQEGNPADKAEETSWTNRLMLPRCLPQTNSTGANSTENRAENRLIQVNDIWLRGRDGFGARWIQHSILVTKEQVHTLFS